MKHGTGNSSKTTEGVLESLWKPHQSKEHKISDRYGYPNFFPTPKKYYFFRDWKTKVGNFAHFEVLVRDPIVNY